MECGYLGMHSLRRQESWSEWWWERKQSIRKDTNKDRVGTVGKGQDGVKGHQGEDMGKEAKEGKALEGQRERKWERNKSWENSESGREG